ncbi:MAG: type II secretion system minor pseudopilin GspJ [Pseudomonadales bacterium]|nr:type II secretion system minor pseudopilin GspJ [Pseudomonadales bacterium]
MNSRQLSGFTLIELLVALTIFAIMSAGIFTIFSSFQNVKDVTDRDSRRLYELQKAFNVIGRDITQMVPRPILDEFGSVQPALKGEDNTVEFTRAGWNRPPFIKTKRSELQRVRYLLEEGALLRFYWNVLDRADNSEPKNFAVLEGVEEVKFKFFRHTDQKEIKEEFSWPSIDASYGSNSGSSSTGQGGNSCGIASRESIELPLILEVSIVTEDFGELTKKYLIQAEYANAIYTECT